MEYTTEQIQEMAKTEANDKKNEDIKLDYQDGIYYGFQRGFEKALSLFAVSGRSELLKFLNWYVKDEALRSKPDRLTNIVDRYLKEF